MALFDKKTKDTKGTAKPAVSGSARLGTDFTLALTPLVSEKSSLMEAQNQYTFKVGVGVNKIMVKKAVEARYGVRVVGVNRVNLPGKIVRRGRTVGKRVKRVHMMVRLAPGQTITTHLGKA